MEEKTTKNLKEPVQVIYKGKKTTTSPADCGEGGVYQPNGSDG
ncbi:hypothetical protein [Desulforamulus putei]|nr:hypothetical protein [Desulforamulus putei]